MQKSLRERRALVRRDVFGADQCDVFAEPVGHERADEVTGGVPGADDDDGTRGHVVAVSRRARFERGVTSARRESRSDARARGEPQARHS